MHTYSDVLCVLVCVCDNAKLVCGCIVSISHMKQVHVFVEIIGYDCWDQADSCCCGVMVKLQASRERLHSNLSLPVLFCPSWTLCRRKSSRRSREPSTSSPWAQVCPRPCSRPRNTHTVFGRHSLSPDWVRSYYSSIICIIFFCITCLHI